MDWVTLNRRAWNLRTGVHIKSSEVYYPLEAVRKGGISLYPLECSLVGNVKGLKLLHLQCHFGLDTLSWARLGAEVTGVDYSDMAINKAIELAAEMQLEATFVCMDVQDMSLPAVFDVAVSTYGILPWIGDLSSWAQGIQRALKPGGIFVLVEYHPVIEVLYPGKFSGHGRYFGSSTPVITESSGTYTDPSAPIHYQECRWQHTLGDVVSALVDANLSIVSLREYAEVPIPLVPNLEKRDRCWVDPHNRAPLLFSVVARRT